MYLALYRKYRPKKFNEIIGQDHIVKTLQNQIALDKVGHAYLFCGSRGTGKTSTAKIFARELNCTCEHKNTCKFCKEELSLDILEIDAASNNGVDEIRDLREKVKYPPVDGKYKVYIIDEVHMLSPSAFNALLKTLEEPPKHAIFILATTEVHKLPQTILSRCMRFDFKLVAIEELISHLKNILKKENIQFEEDAVELIARAGEGSVRDTLSIADRCISYADKLTRQSVIEILGETERQSLIALSDIILNGNVGDALIKLDELLKAGKSPAVLSKDLIYYYRDLLLINVIGEKSANMVMASAEDFNQMQKQATNQNYAKIVQAIELLSSVEAELRYSVQPRIVLESVIIRLFSQTNLLQRIEKLEKMIASGALAEPEQTRQERPAQTAQKAEGKEEIPAVKLENSDRIIGELLAYLRDNKQMSLLMACRQISKAVVENNEIILYIKDKSAINMIKMQKNLDVLNEYFKSIHTGWQIKEFGDNSAANNVANKFKNRL